MVFDVLFQLTLHHPLQFESSGVVGCGIDLFMGALEGSDLASFLTVTDVCNVALVNSKCYQAMEKYTPFVDVKRVIFDVIGSCGLLENDPVPSFSRVCRIYKELEQNTHATLRRLQHLYSSPKLECLDRDINQLIDQSFEERYVALDEDEDVFGLNGKFICCVPKVYLSQRSHSSPSLFFCTLR